MTSWLFCIKDNACDMTLVVGTGEDVEAAEVDADTKWHAEFSTRDDYADRLPIKACTVSCNCTGSNPPSLIL